MPAETPAPPASEPSPLGRLTAITAEGVADIRKAQEDLIQQREQAKGWIADSAAETNRILDLQQQRVGAVEQSFAGLQDQFARLPAAPQAPEEPPVPSREAKPFLNLGENAGLVQSLNTTLYSLGLLAQMGMGIAKGYPAGALAAYSGALDGWAKGDAVRAENLWKEYLAAVGKMSREYQRQRQEYQDILDRFGMSKDLVATQLTLAAAQNGLDSTRIQLAQKAPEQFMKMIDLFDNTIRQLGTDAVKLNAGLAQAYIAKERDDQLNRYRQDLLQLKRQEAAGGGDAGGFSASAIEKEARVVAAGGPMPALGWGKAATQAKIRILNRAAEIRDQLGDTEGGYSMRRLTYQANKSALTKLESQRAPMMAFARTADKNLDLALELSDQVDRTGASVLNRWLLAGRRATGDPRVSAFDAAVRTAINETAKVTSSATGGGVTSDTARKEIESMLNAVQTPAQFKAVVKTLKTDMANRQKGYEEEVAVIRQAVEGQMQPQKGGVPSAVGMELEQELGLK